MTPDPARRRLMAAAALVPALALAAPALASDTEEGRVIDLKVDLTYARLLDTVPGARELAEQARGVLVVPDVTKAGLVVGGLYGEGALRVNGSTVGYYSVAAASFGLQAGAQRFDQALFFMTTKALEDFRRSRGWEAGADAAVTYPGNGLSTELSTTTARNPVIGVVFGQEGLMAGVSVEGAKYTRILN